ncbi:unnamed protein product, partial [Adineta ricciae]
MEYSDDSLRCPISLELFEDPVIGDDGHTYERKNIITWLEMHGTSPLTREPMDTTSLKPNHLIRKLVHEFRTRFEQKQYEFRLDVDVCKSEDHPLFVSFGRIVYKAEWIGKQNSSVCLLNINGVRPIRESSFYAQLSCHPNIVHTYGIVRNDLRSVLFLQELTLHGDLSYQLREQDFHPSNRVLIEIFIQLINALIYLTKNNIVHGNLACRSALAFRLHPSEEKHNLFKLTDYGITIQSTIFSIVDDGTDNNSSLMTRPFRSCAPEILRKKSYHVTYSEKSDVYSMGVLIWEAHSQGQIPFESIENDSDVRRARRSGLVLERPQSCDTALWTLVELCWQLDPDCRPSFQSLKDNILKLCNDSNPSDIHDSLISESQYTSGQRENTTLNDFNQYPDNS